MIIVMYLPTGFMEEDKNNSNEYVEKRKALEPDLQIWDQKHKSAPFDT